MSAAKDIYSQCTVSLIFALLICNLRCLGANFKAAQTTSKILIVFFIIYCQSLFPRQILVAPKNACAL